MNVLAELSFDQEMVAGINVPPAPSLGVAVAAGTAPFGVAVKLLDATPEIADDGPVKANDVAGLDAVRLMLDGVTVVGEPEVIETDIVFDPADPGVYVNVLAVFSAVHVTDVGVNVPPAPPSFGVAVVGPVTVPSGVSVKSLDAVPTMPVVGPVRVN